MQRVHQIVTIRTAEMMAVEVPAGRVAPVCFVLRASVKSNVFHLVMERIAAAMVAVEAAEAVKEVLSAPPMANVGRFVPSVVLSPRV